MKRPGASQRVFGIRAWPLAMALAMLGACAGTEVGNPATDAEPLTIALSARSSDPGVAFEDASDVAVVVDELWVTLGDLRFVLDDDCASDRDSRFTLPGPTVAELSHSLERLEADLPDADYCRLRVSLERASADDPDVPEQLVGYSALLRGHRSDGVGFLIRTRDKPDLVLRSMDEPFRLHGDDSPLVLGFDAAAWLNDIDLSGLEPDGAGEIVIDPDHETTLLRLFETNLRASLGLYRDLDRNGAIDDREADTPLAR